MEKTRDDGLEAALRPVRSALFVPANREPWIAKSPMYGADVVVLDLEDATPPAEKQARADDCPASRFPTCASEARASGCGSTRSTARSSPGTSRRSCSPGSKRSVCPRSRARRPCASSTRCSPMPRPGTECRRGTVRIVPLLETAPAILGAADVFRSSSRVAYGGGIVAPSGDVALAIGFRWSDTFEETFVLRSQVLIAARACGIENPITGLVTSVDPEPVRRFAAQSRALGYDGMFVIHPSHVAIANDAFRPSPEELELVYRDPRGRGGGRAGRPRDLRRLAGTHDRRGHAARRATPPRARSRLP